jgi:hypothetical protein
MTKQEALKKIEELKKYVEGCDKPKVGQVWKHLDGTVYIVVENGSKLSAVCVSKPSHSGTILGSYACDYFNFKDRHEGFTYVGEAEEVLKYVGN